MRESRNEAKREERAERVPLGIKRKKLDVANRDPGFVYRWINDIGGRLIDAERGGYEFVTSDAKAGQADVANRNSSVGDRMSKIVGKNDSGHPITAFLMRIRKEWYDADQNAKKARLAATDAALKRGQAKPVDNSYIPAQGINFDEKEGEHAGKA
jgi:hypothetical protein